MSVSSSLPLQHERHWLALTRALVLLFALLNSYYVSETQIGHYTLYHHR